MKKFGISAMTVGAALTLAACGAADNNDMDNDGADITINDENNNANVNVDENDDVDANADADADADTDSEENSEADSDEGESEWYDDLKFKDFELEAEYSDGQYEVEYEYNDGNPEAEIEDTRDGADIDMEGQEALDELEAYLPELDLTADSSDEEVFEQVIEVFGLDENYDELEVEIEFFDDEELEAEND